MTEPRAIRLFVAADIDAAARATLAAAIDEMKRALGRRGQEAADNVRWERSEKLHITLRFIGYVREPQSSHIRDVLAAPLRISPFQMTVAGAGTFPVSGAPRIVWAGVAAGAELLTILQREVEARVCTAACQPEERAFHPHVTLARVRPGSRTHMAQVRHVVSLASIPPARVAVDHVTLYESQVSAAGSTYHERMRVPLEPAS